MVLAEGQRTPAALMVLAVSRLFGPMKGGEGDCGGLRNVTAVA